jgi:hypothetical protein
MTEKVDTEPKVEENEEQKEEFVLGPTLPPSNAPMKPMLFTDLKAAEQYAYVRGKMSYFDILYAKYTPCGMLYEDMKPFILTKAEAKRQKKNTLDPNLPIVKQFQTCLSKNQEFYERRAKNINDFKKSVFSL